jgi:hypothetical protein
VAYPREGASQNPLVSQDIDKNSFPSLSQPGPFPFIFSATPEAIPKIKAKKEKKEGECSKKVEDNASPSQGISVPSFLELGSCPVQFPCFGIRVAEGAVRSDEAKGIIFLGLNG